MNRQRKITNFESLIIVCSFAGWICSPTNAHDSLRSQTKDTGSVGITQQDTQQKNRLAHREIPISYDSGIIRIDSSSQIVDPETARSIQVPVWSQVVRVDDAGWVRLRFEDVVLAKSTEQVRESYIRISSLEDGYEQYLDTRSLGEWSNSSAYFNGNAVRVELMASPNASAQINRIKVSGVQASGPTTGSARSICFTTDDRELSNDPRVARLMPNSYTGTLIDDHGGCLLSAYDFFSIQTVAQFNVPLSTGNLQLNHPPPQDQYAIDQGSIHVANSDDGFANWLTLGVFDNSNTGLTPVQSQGPGYTIATTQPPADGHEIHMKGHGASSGQLLNTWHFVQLTSVGPLTRYQSSRIYHQIDTLSQIGSPIIESSTDQIIGVHTNSGCTPSGEENYGSSVFDENFWIMLANPRGICIQRTIRASVSFEPTHVSPAGTDTMSLIVENDYGRTLKGAPMMLVDSGNGFESFVMKDMRNGEDKGVFTSTFPTVECGTELAYYFEVRDTDGNLTSIPDQGADRPFQTIAVDELVIVTEDSFNTDTGWSRSTMGQDVNGGWIRVLPLPSGTVSRPSHDSDGSRYCYVTGIAENDVDNGTVSIMSNFYDISQADEPVLKIDTWMYGEEDSDAMTISVTGNGGFTWIDLDRLTNTDGWLSKSYVLGNYINDDFLVRVRVTVQDGGDDTIVEGAIDDFRIEQAICNSACPADITDDGILDFFDVSAFLDAFGAQEAIADITDDGVYDFFDVSAFLDAFGAGCP